MSCDYQKFIDKLLDGNLNDDKLTQLKEHALECKECNDKLMQIELTDKIIKNDLLNVPYVSNKDVIMQKIGINESKMRILSALYKSRKYICTAAAILVIVVSVQLIKPYINFRSSTAQNTNPASVDINKKIPDNTSDNNAADNNNQNNSSSVGTCTLKFNLPSDWRAEVNQYVSDYTVTFYEKGVENGALLVNKINNEVPLIDNITPNHSELLWSEDISVPLGKGKIAAFKITSPAAAAVQTEEFEISAIIPISDQQAYEIWINPKDAGSGSKKSFMDIINNISQNEESDNNQDIYIKNISLKTSNTDLSTIASQMMEKYFAQFKENTTGKDMMISDFKIIKIDQIKGDNNNFKFFIDYSLKPADIKSYVLCGNGELSGEWIINKNAFVEIEKDDGAYKIKSIGTGP